MKGFKHLFLFLAAAAARQPAMFTQRTELAVKDFGLALQALQLVLAGVVQRGDGRVHLPHAGLGPWC